MGTYGAAGSAGYLKLAGAHAAPTEEWATVYLYSDKNTVAKEAFPWAGRPYETLVKQMKENIGFTSVYDFILAPVRRKGDERIGRGVPLRSRSPLLGREKRPGLLLVPSHRKFV